MQINVKIDTAYTHQAKNFIDLLFEKGMFHEDITRSQMQVLEDYLAEQYQGIHDSTERIITLLDKYKKEARNDD